ncbi:glycosyltransferase [Litorivita sp. NS0012-18]|uniref:glycosyltransferase family 2 protein n=1 Tax=Litorivita sp. NS0012-18 TaxID=3127655 RepID=UPI0031048982
MTAAEAPLTVSVVIVSRARADALRLCLTAVSRLIYPAFEVILVADPEGVAAADDLGLTSEIKTVAFDEANICAARNLGIAEAAGDIVAFIDDDAVPEPLWLTHLTAPFGDPEVMAVGGYVLGRNGISFQWKARSIDRAARSKDITLPDETRAAVLHPTPERAIKTEGTNMAVRRDLLAQMGGFDPAFRFYLDESDLNLRLAAQGHATAIAPLAQVHHGYAASSRRHANRAPRDLSQIGASLAVYLRKHCPESQRAARLAEERMAQNARLSACLIDGRLEPRDIRRLRRSLDAGMAEGQSRPIAPLPAIGPAPRGLKAFSSRATGSHRALAGRLYRAKALKNIAKTTTKEGNTVTLYLFSATALFHHIRFTSEGYWLHTGGIFGRSLRSGPLFKLYRLMARAKIEASRVSRTRGDAQF